MDGFLRCIYAITAILAVSFFEHTAAEARLPHFDSNGQFKIVQVADMHYANGATTVCLDVLPEQMATCSDLNTTAFLWRMIDAEKPDLIVFTGDNIMQIDSHNATASLLAAFAPAIEAKIPWAVVLGNHDQEGNMSREEVMEFIVKMDYALAQVNPHFTVGDRKTIDGFGNYIIEVAGASGSPYENKSVLNLYMVDSGDYSAIPDVSYYDWVKSSQQVWLQQASAKIQRAYKQGPMPQDKAAPALAFHHIPVPESFSLANMSILGTANESSGSADINSGFLTTLVSMGDVVGAFTGHDHLNDYCGAPVGEVFLCYSGGFGYHAYGSAGWPRRSRVITTYLKKGKDGNWEDIDYIQTWKRLDDGNFTKIDEQTLYTNYA